MAGFELQFLQNLSGYQVSLEPVAHLALDDRSYRAFQLVSRPEMSAGQPSLEIPPRGLNRVELRRVRGEKLKGDVVSCRFHVLPNRF